MTVFVTVLPENPREQAMMLGHLDAEIEKATYRALNVAADRVRTQLDKRLRAQIAFPAAYLRPSGGRLVVSERARKDNLEVVIRGRDQPTSLARFATYRKPGAPKGGRGIQVRVKPGVAKYIKGAWIVRLKNGNLGLAVRTPDGARPRGAYVPKKLANGVWLLYGPSVDQALHGVRSRNGGLFGDMEPEAMRIFEGEFWRLLDKGIA